MNLPDEQHSLARMKQNVGRAESMLKVLANGNRLMILCNLVEGRMTVSELLERLDLSQSALSQHLARMREEGLIASDKQGQQVYYSILAPEVRAILSTLYLVYCR